MLRSRLLAAAAFTSLLAACAGGGTPSVPSAPQPSSSFTAPSRTMTDARGEVAVVTFTKEVQDTINLLDGGTAGGRVTMRHSSGGNLTLHGGPVSTAPEIYLVLYGSAWGGATGGGSGDPDGAVSYLNGYYPAVSGTGWHNTETQYYGANGVHIPNTITYHGVIYDSTNPPSSPTQSQMASEAAKIAQQTGKAGPNVSYVIALPSGVHPSGFITQWCAWHSSTSSSVGTVSYTNLPYQPDAGTSCGSNWGTNAGFSIVGGHEQAETETDPQPNTGWLDGSGSEIGDKCAWTNIGNWVGSYPSQPLWDNAISGCATSGP